MAGLMVVSVFDYSHSMERVKVSVFKATCSRLLDRVRETGEPLEILKNGKPLAVVQPPPVNEAKAAFGARKAALFTGPLGDVVSPAVEWAWEVSRKK